MKIIPNHDGGIQNILTIINLLKDKNYLYLKGTFKWLLETHPPFPGSYITYNPESNSFLHKKLPILFENCTWETYSADKWVKEKHFSYDLCRPYEVIVGSSQWIIMLRERKVSYQVFDQVVAKWIEQYHIKVEEEREHWKSLLSSHKPRVDVPLF